MTLKENKCLKLMPSIAVFPKAKDNDSKKLFLNSLYIGFRENILEWLRRELLYSEPLVLLLLL